MKKIYKLLIVFLLIVTFSFSEEVVQLSFESSAAVIAYQQSKNREIQHLLDSVYGVERVMIDIKVNVVKHEEVLSSPTNLLLPGVPVQQIDPVRVGNVYYLNSYDINLWIATDIDNQATVEEMIRDVMEFNKYPQSTILINRAIDKKSKAQTIFNEDTIQGIKEIMNTINISIRVPEIGSILQATSSNFGGQVKNQMDLTTLIVILVGFFILIIIVVLFIVVFGKNAKDANNLSVNAKGGKDKLGEGEDEMIGMKAGAMGSSSTTISAGGGGMGGDFSAEITHKQGGDEDEITQEKSTLFTFIEESNIFKLAFILQQEKPKGKNADMDEYWQNVAIIVSFLPSHLSRIIFMKYTIEEQSEIIPYLAYEIDYPIEQIQELEKQFREKLENLVLVGGKRSVMPILDKFSNQKKSELAKQLNEKHPDVLTEIRDMIILFEDLMRLPKDSLTRLLMEVDPNMLALCFINMPEDERADIFSDLSKGLQSMINEVIDLRKDNYTEVEVQDATDTLIQQAKLLNRRGLIKLNLTGFGEQEGAIEQEEIDKLFEEENTET